MSYITLIYLIFVLLSQLENDMNDFKINAIILFAIKSFSS